MTPARGGRGTMVVRLLAVALLAAGPQDPGDARPLTVVAQVRPTTCYVGQAVELAVGVVSEGERPRVEAPRIAGAEVELVRTEQVPISTSAIGDLVRQQSLFRFRYRIVPRRPGTLVVPRVAATLGERTGSSDPLRLTARDVPRVDRPATFLGGVGTFEVEATAEPAAVRLGQSFEYRLTIRGPAARGSEGAPAVDRLASVPLALTVERRPDVVDADTPSRTFVYRLRPTRPGRATLPPVAVSAFDPATGRFVTKASKGVAVEAREVAAFDPATVDYPVPGPVDGPSVSRLAPAVAVAVAAGALAVAGATVGIVRFRRRGGPARVLARLPRDLGRRLAAATDPTATAQVVTDGLVAYLGLTTARPPGALTPDDAADGVARATGRDDLARRAAALVRDCDRVLYGADGHGVGDDLATAGRALIGELTAAVRVPATVPGTRGPETPREAVDPAS